jgi:hypothetical protein
MDRTEPPTGRPQPLAACATCRQKHQRPERDAWGERMDWWDCWPCNLCGRHVCNMPTSIAPGATLPCYVKHVAAEHPELYQLGSVGDSGIEPNLP